MKSPGLKGLGLKLGVEKSGVEMTFNHFKGTKVQLLKRHLRRMHGQSEIEKVFGEKPEWDCPHCEFKAPIKNEVKRHIGAEHGEKELRAYKLRDIKGQLISKCLLGVIVSTKKPTNFFKDFCPSL